MSNVDVNIGLYKLSFILVVLFFTINVQSQEFAPLDSKWTYQSIGSSGWGFPVAYQFRTEKDTIIDGKYSTVISLYSLYESGDWEPTTSKSEIVSSSESGDTVFVYFRDSFHIIYDFTAEVGDTITVTDEPFDGFFYDSNYQQSRFVYKIDSIKSVSYGVDTFLTQYVSYLSTLSDTIPEWGFRDITDFSSGLPGRIIKDIGSLNRIGILGTSSDFTYHFSDEPSYLTCYEDPNRYYNFRNFDCDSLVSFYTSIDDLPTDSPEIEISIFPNPFFNSLFIHNEEYKVHTISLFDSTGGLINRIKPGSSETHVDTSDISPGIYFLSILLSEGKVLNYRVIKRV